MWDQPPQPVQPTTIRSVPILYNADTGQKVGGRMQRWASTFMLPGMGAVKVRFVRPPGTASNEPAGVVRDDKLGEDVLYVDPTWYTRKNYGNPGEMAAGGRKLMTHELAHIYDRTRLTDETRQRFQQIMGDSRSWRPASGTTQQGSPHEQFAEAAQAYSRGFKRPSFKWMGGYGFEPSAQQWNQIRMLLGGLK
jgi:hypothetical protein